MYYGDRKRKPNMRASVTGDTGKEMILRIYLDNCTFNRPFDNQLQMKIRLETEAKLYIQSGIREKKYTLVWSYILDFENDGNPYEEKRKSIAPWKEIADSYCASSDDILSATSENPRYAVRRGFFSSD
jgi:hypothetical protein